MWRSGFGATVAERVALCFAYDGTAFDGFARQPEPGLRTVEGCLLDALVATGLQPERGALAWRTGSRTDRGVSARENVVVFTSRAPAERVALALAGRVAGVWPLSSVRVAEDFDPRRAVWREYRYFLSGPRPADWRERFATALRLFVGTHDFRAFSKSEADRDPVRRVDRAEVVPSAEGAVVRVVGPAFLRQQVRRMVAAAMAVADGRRSLEDLRRGLGPDAPVFDVMPAPAEALVLWAVRYDQVRFPRQEATWARVEADRVAARSEAWARGEMHRSAWPSD